MGKADKKGKKKKGGKYESLSEEGEGYFDVLDDHFELDAESDDDFDDEVPEEVPGYDSDTLWQTGGIEVVRSEGPAGLVTEEEGNGERWRSKGSKVLKTLRHFSYALLDRAIAANYEEEQIADILSLIIAEMGYQKDLDGLRKLLEKVSAGPGLLAALKERGLASLPASSVLALLSQSASNADKFIKFIAEAMEMEVLAVHRNVQANEELFETMSSFIQSSFDLYHKKCFAVAVCEQLPSKQHCARFLQHLTASLPSTRDKARFISDVITKEYFRDVLGKMKDFKEKLSPELAEALDILLDMDFDVDNEGELVESDADSEGNLRGFIVDDNGGKGKNKRRKGKGKDDSNSEESSSSDSGSDESSEEDEEFDEEASKSSSNSASSSDKEENVSSKKKKDKVNKKKARVNLNESSDEESKPSTTAAAESSKPAPKRRKILDSDEEES